MNVDFPYTTKHPTPLPGCVLSSRGTHSIVGQMLPSLLGAHTREHKKVCIMRQVTLDIIFGIPHKSGSKRDF